MVTVLLSVVLQVAEPPARGLFLGDELRYQRGASVPEWTKGLVLRTFADLVSIPSTIVDWSLADWAIAGAVVLPTATGWVPVNGRALDAQLQDALHRARGANCELAPPGSTVCDGVPRAAFHLWTPPSNVVIGASQVAGPLLLLAAGAIFQHAELLEVSTLAVEAYCVAQLYHLSLKLLTGREGVLTDTGAGRFFGPTKLSFPDGFPSGHAASLFALIGVYSTYVGAAWLHVVLLGVGVALATFLVLDDYHFASEVVFGAATGFLIGRWVVRRRASKEWYEPTTVAPSVTSSGAGLSLRWDLPSW